MIDFEVKLKCHFPFHKCTECKWTLAERYQLKVTLIYSVAIACSAPFFLSSTTTNGF